MRVRCLNLTTSVLVEHPLTRELEKKAYREEFLDRLHNTLKSHITHSDTISDGVREDLLRKLEEKND